MQRKADKLKTAKERAALLLEEAEKQRAAVRFERGLLELENDRFSVLNNTEFAKKIVDYLYSLFVEKESTESSILYDKLFSHFVVGEQNEKKIILSIFERLGAIGLENSNIKFLQFLCSKFSKCLSDECSDMFLSFQLCQFLAKATVIFVRSNQWNDVDNLLSVLWSIRTISFETSAGPVEPVPDILSSIATNEAIEKIFQYHNRGDQDEKEKAQKYIKYLGDKAVAYLLNRLIHSVSKEDRFLIIGLIGGLGDRAISEISRGLDTELPWYAIRNIIFIITEIGEFENFSLVEKFLEHPDIRVQQQVVACIVKLGGKDVEKRLLKALSLIHDEIKMKLIMQLGEFKSEDVANGLIGLLHKRDFFPDNIREELIFRICVSLRAFAFPNVINLLKHLLSNSENTLVDKEKIRIAINETIKIIEPQIRHKIKGESSDTDMYEFDPEKEYQVTLGINDFMAEMNVILKRGEKEKASTLIYKKILKSARSKDFITAEKLRDKLLDINPDALQDVIRAAEIIEEEKNTPVTSHHIETWEKLYDTMSTEEFNAFFYTLKQEVYRPNEPIVTIGEIDPCLYFINSGTVLLNCGSAPNVTFLRRLGAGEIFGVGQFFSVSVWTVSVTAQDSCQLHVLNREDFWKVRSRFPELEEKLHDFCRKMDNVPDLIQMSGNDRRVYARYPVKVTVNNILLDPYGRSTGKRVFQGEMIDISRGGLSFSIRISVKENANQLLGKQIISEINLQGSEVLKCFGTIVGVKYQHEIVKEFSVHIKFYSEIKQSQVTDVLNLVI